MMSKTDDPSIPSFYKPIHGELARVEASLHEASIGGFAGLSSLLSHVLGSPGKRIRPAVELLSGKAFREDRSDLLVLMGTAVELLHIATLIHDDTVDNSPLRRGKPTVSSAWGRDVAVLLGDYVFANSAVYVCNTNNVRAIKSFSETLMALSSGELREIISAYDWRQTREDYWERIKHKTASLFATAGETGALLADAPEKGVQAMKSYGHNVGMAFQIIDDILDFEGTEAEVGKPVGNDLLQGTLTLPALLIIERYPKDNPIQRLFQKPAEQEHLKAAVEMIRNSSVIQESADVAKGFGDKALEAVKGLPNHVYRRSLEEIVEYVLSRNK